MRTKDEIEALKNVKEKLKECKPEWLEKNAKGQDSLGVLTVQQILDYATDAVTSWNFSLEEQWREEVNKFDKQSGQWSFDGYVYHVRGTLHIEGLGSRSQYGSKVAIGGKDNQNSSYKAAASDCLKKCASLFGVGSSIYSKIKIETEEEAWQQQNQQNVAYMYNYQQKQNQQQHEQEQVALQEPQQVTLPNGDVQQGEYIWSLQSQTWIHQSEYQSNQGGHYPRLNEQQQQQQWYHNTMQQYDPNGYQAMRQQTGPSPEEVEYQKTQEAIQFANQATQQGTVAYPFENVPAPTPEAQAQPFEATPQQEAQPQDFQAVQYGAPTEAQAENAPVTETATKEAPKEQADPLAHVVPENPWNTPENQEQIELFRQHKERLHIDNDSKLLPHVREYFKDEKATIASVTPETLSGFNGYLQNIQV